MNFSYSSAARNDVSRLWAFLATKNPVAAADAIEHIVDAIDSLSQFPDRGRRGKDIGTRELVVPFGRYGYIVQYAHLEEQRKIIVLRIWHGLEDRA